MLRGTLKATPETRPTTGEVDIVDASSISKLLIFQTQILNFRPERAPDRFRLCVFHLFLVPCQATCRSLRQLTPRGSHVARPAPVLLGSHHDPPQRNSARLNDASQQVPNALLGFSIISAEVHKPPAELLEWALESTLCGNSLTNGKP